MSSGCPYNVSIPRDVVDEVGYAKNTTRCDNELMALKLEIPATEFLEVDCWMSANPSVSLNGASPPRYGKIDCTGLFVNATTETKKKHKQGTLLYYEKQYSAAVGRESVNLKPSLFFRLATAQCLTLPTGPLVLFPEEVGHT